MQMLSGSIISPFWYQNHLPIRAILSCQISCRNPSSTFSSLESCILSPNGLRKSQDSDVGDPVPLESFFRHISAEVIWWKLRRIGLPVIPHCLPVQYTVCQAENCGKITHLKPFFQNEAQLPITEENHKQKTILLGSQEAACQDRFGSNSCLQLCSWAAASVGLTSQQRGAPFLTPQFRTQHNSRNQNDPFCLPNRQTSATTWGRSRDFLLLSVFSTALWKHCLLQAPLERQAASFWHAMMYVYMCSLSSFWLGCGSTCCPLWPWSSLPTDPSLKISVSQCWKDKCFTQQAHLL